MADDITQWLEELGLGQYAQVFAENDIDLEVLSDLDDADLEKLGVSMSAANIVFTPVNRLNLNFAISLAKPSKSRGLVIRIFSPPCACLPQPQHARKFR